MATPSCAPCIFGAAQSSILTFPATVQVAVVSVGVTIDAARNLTSTVTSTLQPTTTLTAGPGQPPIVTSTVSSGQAITWETLGATLTYPTTYVDYISFQGAAVVGTGCASNIAPAALTVPANVPTASLIYSQPPAGQLPSGLLSYLDGLPGFIGQLNNDRLELCAAIPGNLPAVSSVTRTITTTTPVTETITSNVPPPTTYTTTGSSTTTITTVEAVSGGATPGVIVSLSTITDTVVTASGFTVTLPPQQVTLPGSTTTTVPYAALISALSELSSKVSAARVSTFGVYTNSTSTIGSATAVPPTVPASRASSIASYTGAAATPAASMVAGSYIAGLLGLVLYL